MQKLTVNDSTKGSSSTALAFTLAVAAKFTYSVTVTRTHCECAACLLLVPPGPQAIGPNHSPYSALDNGMKLLRSRVMAKHKRKSQYAKAYLGWVRLVCVS